MRLYWIKVDPKSNECVLEGTKKNAQRHTGKKTVNMEAEIGKITNQGFHESENLKDTKKDSPLASSEGACPASTLILGNWTR